MNDELAAYLVTYCLLAIPVVFVIGLVKQVLNEESVHSEDFSSKLEDSHQDKKAA